MHKVADRAYLAGLIDGEGSIGIDNHGGVRSPSVRITLTNSGLDMLAEMKAIWGGWLSTRRKRKLSWKAVSDLIWAGKPTSKLLKEIQPYLRVKQEQCRIALLFNKTVSSSNTSGVSKKIQDYRQELRKQILEANKRGTK